jgi:hypothetical protein
VHFGYLIVFSRRRAGDVIFLKFAIFNLKSIYIKSSATILVCSILHTSIVGII